MTESEEKFENSESIFRVIAENAHDLISILNQNYEIEYLNEKAHARILGYSKEELVGTKVLSLIDPVHLQTARDRFSDSLETGKGSGELRFKHKDGHYVWLEIRGTIYTDEDGAKKSILISRDITKRKVAETTLKESEKRYRSFLHHFQGIAYRGGMDWKPIFFHGAVEEITGYTDSDFILGKPNWGQIIHPEDFNIIRESTEKIKLVPNYSTEREYRIIRKDGEVRWVYEITRNITDESGKPVKVQGTIYDLTARKSMEEKLKESEEKFKMIADQSLMGIIIVQEGLIKYVNETAATIIEYSVEETLNWTVNDFLKMVHPEDAAFMAEQARIKQSGAPGAITHYSYRIFTKSGKIKWLSLHSKSIPYEAGIADLITIINITEQKEAEQQLIESEEKYRLITENAQDIIGIINQKYQFEYINEEALKATSGFSSEDLIGKNPLEFVHPADQEHVSKALIKGFEVGGAMVEARVKHKDGHYLWLEIMARTFKDKDGELKAISISRDITERKMTEEVIRERLKFEKLISNISSRFVSSLSFDESINDSLADIGKLSGASRAYLFQLKNDKTLLDNTHEWCAEGVRPQKDNLQNMPSEMYPWSMRQLLGGDVIHIRDVSELPDKATGEKELFESHGIKSLLILPIFSAEELIGFIGFDNVIKAREWRDLDLETLRITSQIIANAFERRQAEQKLKESEEKFKSITEQSLMGILILQDDAIKYANEAASNIGEYTLQEMLNWTPYEYAKLIHPDDAKFVLRQARIKQTGEPGAIAHYYLRFMTKSGKMKWVSLYSKSIPYQGRTADLITIIDITLRKEAEQQLLESEERYRFIAENIDDGISVLDKDLKIEYLNKAIGRLSGYSIDEIMSKTALEFVHPDDIGRAMKLLEEGLKVGTGWEEFRLRRKDGAYLWVEVVGKVIHDKNNEIKFILSNRDISKRKLLEQQLKESEELYRTLFKISPDAITATDLQGNITELSEKTLELYGWEMADELLGKSAFDFIDPQDQERALINLKKTLDMEFLGPMEYSLARKDGTFFIGEVKAAVLRAASGSPKGFIASVRDITDRKRAEAELKEAYNRAEFYKDLLSHDVTNILQNILFSAESGLILLDEKEKLKAKLFDIKDQVKKSAKLISDVRKLSKLEKTKPILQPIEVQNMLDNSKYFIEKGFQERKIDIQIDAPERKLYVQANEFFRDVVENILHNAVKYNQNSTVEIMIRVSREQKDREYYLRLQFLDNGVGIRDISKTAIFERGYRENGNVSGRGIGLSLVKKIISSYDGNVWVEDRVEGDFSQGSNFIILIPEARTILE
ncbi:MAG: PAS domain S-box protein [Candidatus Helarchaeota archaeon]|nr:PAS domain S-box protein [Candidatus Helarchaeota archaeon]